VKILLVNKFYYPRGGAERYFFLLKEMLEKSGHTVIVFSMQDDRNLPSPYSRFFVSHVDFDRVRFDWQGVRTAGRMVYSFEARRKLEQLIKEEKPDIAHLFNIYHQISPSILPVLKRHRIPVVQTLFDMKLLSPNYLLYAHGGICEHGKGFRYYECAFHRCIKGSFVASALAAIEMYFHKLAGFYEKNVETFIVPSHFLLEKLREWRVRIRDVRVIPNFIDVPKETPLSVGSDILFFGRLSEEKGVEDLVVAAQGLPYPVTIVGSGPQEAFLKKRASALGATNITFLGFVSDDVLDQHIRESRLVVVPSRCYENMPLSILEAFARKKPVIAPSLGSMPELVQPGKTGLLYTPGSPDDLREKILTLAENETVMKQYSENAYRFVQRFSAERFYQDVSKVYEELLSRHR